MTKRLNPTPIAQPVRKGGERHKFRVTETCLHHCGTAASLSGASAQLCRSSALHSLLEDFSGCYWDKSSSCPTVHTEYDDCPSSRIDQQGDLGLHEVLSHPWLTIEGPILCSLGADNHRCWHFFFLRFLLLMLFSRQIIIACMFEVQWDALIHVHNEIKFIFLINNFTFHPPFLGRNIWNFLSIIFE